MNRNTLRMRDHLLDYYTANGRNDNAHALALMDSDEDMMRRGFKALAKRMMRDSDWALEGDSYTLPFAWKAAREFLS